MTDDAYEKPLIPIDRRRTGRSALAATLLALLAACQTAPPSAPAPSLPGNVSRLPPGNSERDGPEASPPPNLELVPDAVPQIEPLRIGGPNKPYAIGGQTYVPITDDRPIAEKGLASWYGKKFHGHRTASGEAYNMYAMTAAHKTLPIPSYVRVRNPSNGHEIIVRVNDRGPFSPDRIIDLSYTAALKLGVLGGTQPVEISRITADDIRSGAAYLATSTSGASHGLPTALASPSTTVVVGDLDRVVSTARTRVARKNIIAPMSGDVVATGVDLGAAAATDAQSALDAAVPATATLPSTAAVSSSAGSAVTPAVSEPSAQTPPPPEPREERGHAETTAGAGYWIQLGAYRQRDGALDFQHRLIDEQPWLAPLLAVFTDHGLNKLQAGPYPSRDEARTVAERIRTALRLVPTIVLKR